MIRPCRAPSILAQEQAYTTLYTIRRQETSIFLIFSKEIQEKTSNRGFCTPFRPFCAGRNRSVPFSFQNQPKNRSVSKLAGCGRFCPICAESGPATTKSLRRHDSVPLCPICAGYPKPIKETQKQRLLRLSLCRRPGSNRYGISTEGF